MYMNFDHCNTKDEVMRKQYEYNLDIDNLIEFCYTELNLTQQQTESLKDWQVYERQRLGRLARQRLAKLGFTYRVKPEIL